MRLAHPCVPAFLLATLLAAGCGAPKTGPVLVYLDGAGWYSGSGPVETGLKRAGYPGRVYRFDWTANLGPAHDHLVTARDKGVAKSLARYLQSVREADPTGQIDLMGLSAGTGVILGALEELPREIQVDNVVLLSPSVSADHDLSRAMRRVRRNLYATCSPRDALLGSLTVNADGVSGPPAGLRGFRISTRRSAETHRLYERVVNLPWTAAYTAHGWSGSHTGVTSADFIAVVIAPRLLAEDWFPLDRPVSRRIAMAKRDEP